MNDSQAIKALDALYAELPKIICRGKCHESCGPISMTRVEWQRIVDRAGEKKSKSLMAMCPYLAPTLRCSVYGARPMICRLWGIVEDMPCPHGCFAERILTQEEGFEFLRRADELGS